MANGQTQNQILALLKERKNYVSGEDLSRLLKMSRAGLWKHMQELRADGYKIEAVPHEGYRLFAVPDKLLSFEVGYQLETQLVGKKFIHLESVSSTMDEAFQLGLQGAREGTVVCAETQSKGRGRLGRDWVSPKGKGIYFSLLLRPESAPSEVARITLLCAVALCEALQKETGLDPKIKWPNDILLNHKKLAGILTEMNADTDRIKFLVVGVGLNVNTSRSPLPPEATSLKIETRQAHSRIKLLQAILRSLDFWYADFKKNGFESAMLKWKKYSSTLGQRVRLRHLKETVEGLAVDLSTDGGLLIRCDDGRTIKNISGDVQHLLS